LHIPAASLCYKAAGAFRRAGGIAEYHLLPAFGEDGHFPMFSASAVPIWAPIVARFLQLSTQ
jgi:hypothetical protein